MYTDQFRQSVKQNMLPTSACEIDTKIMGGGGGGGGESGQGGGREILEHTGERNSGPQDRIR